MDDSELEAVRIYRATVAGFAFDRDCAVTLYGTGRRHGSTHGVRWWVIRQTRRIAGPGKSGQTVEVWFALLHDPKTQCFEDWIAATEALAWSHIRQVIQPNVDAVRLTS